MKQNIDQAIVWLLNEKYKGKMTERAEKDIARINQGEPVDYVIGYKDFLGCKIDLRYKPLIPREETELWVKKAIFDIKHKLAKVAPTLVKVRILDMFAGSGCCGIAILKSIPEAVCDFCDIEERCLKQIKFNLKLNKIAKERYKIIKSDIFQCLEDGAPNIKLDKQKQYDYILANPPYIARKDIKKVQKSTLEFEPAEALFADEDGLHFIEKFLEKAKDYLKENDVIYLEIGEKQKEQIEAILKKYNYSNFSFHQDQFNKTRWLEIKNTCILLEKSYK